MFNKYCEASAHSLDMRGLSERHTLSAEHQQDSTVRLNGSELKLGLDDALPQLNGTALNAGEVTLAPDTITFFAVPNANNSACRRVEEHVEYLLSRMREGANICRLTGLLVRGLQGMPWRLPPPRKPLTADALIPERC